VPRSHSESPGNPSRCDTWIFVFPNSNDSPATPAKPFVRIHIARAVGGDLVRPEFRVRLRLGAVRSAPVPKATVNEYGDPSGTKDQVWSAIDSRHDRLGVKSETKAQAVQGGAKQALGLGALAASRLHSPACFV
jgi:hypothetical protein